MKKYRVLIVDDSSTARRWLAGLFATDPVFEVCGFAEDGLSALARFDRLQPDLVTLDLEMPQLDGIEVLRRIRQRDARKPVLVVSSQTHYGAARTVDALASGASDYIHKPSLAGDEDCNSRPAFTAQLLNKAKILLVRRPLPILAWDRPAPLSTSTQLPPLAAVLIGSSTGGPEALAQLMPALSQLPVPVLIAQHMPALFTPLLAQRLSQISLDHGGGCVREAVDGSVLGPGDIVLAPGDQHLRIAQRTSEGLLLEVSCAAPVNFCRPSVDMLFSSAADALGPAALGVVLTGMGSDGTAGALELKSAGATLYVQDEQSSVVWGMPGSALRAGAPDRVLPLSALGTAIAQTVRHRQPLSARFPALSGPGVAHDIHAQ